MSGEGNVGRIEDIFAVCDVNDVTDNQKNEEDSDGDNSLAS